MGTHISEETAKEMILSFLEGRGSKGATLREIEACLPMSYDKARRTMLEIRHRVTSNRTRSEWKDGWRYFLKPL